MQSLWLHEARLAEDGLERLDGDRRLEVCIVGGGFTGLWTALRLRERDPSLSVGLIEAERCGSGASGRNGGFVMSWWSKFATLEKLCGSEEALRLARASAAAVHEVGELCERQDVDAHYRRDGWLWTATSQAQLGAWDGTLSALRAHGEEPFTELPREQVARRAGSSAHLGGVFEAGVATVQPALLARALRSAALAAGVEIWERTPMVALARSSPPRVRTPTGTIVADCVVFALNAWAARFRELRRRLVVIASDMVATVRAPERVAELGWGGLCISDSRLLVNYFRATADGRVAWGKAGGTLAFAGRIGASFQGASPRAAEVAASMRRLYPRLADLEIERGWTGPIDRSISGLPFFERLGGRPDLLVGAGYSGNGVGPSVLGGRVLASLALRHDDEWSSCGLVGRAAGGFPPEPARYLGGLAVRAAVARKEDAEDAGRRPTRLDRALAGLAPPGLVPSN